MGSCGTMAKGLLKRKPQRGRAAPGAPGRRRPALLSADPHRAAPIVFLLPDRHDLLQPIDEPVAGLERLGAMRPRSPRCRRSLRRPAPRPSGAPSRRAAAASGAVPGAPAAASRAPPSGERLVLEARHAPARVLVARRAEEEHRRARRRIADRGEQSRRVDAARRRSRTAQPPLTGGKNATSSPSASSWLGIDVALVDGDADAHRGRPRAVRRTSDVPERAGRRARAPRARSSPGPSRSRSEAKNRSWTPHAQPLHQLRPCAPARGAAASASRDRPRWSSRAATPRRSARTTPATARDSIAAGPISANESERNSSPNPSRRLSSRPTTASYVVSRGARPVPPLTITASTPSAISSTMRRARSRARREGCEYAATRCPSAASSSRMRAPLVSVSERARVAHGEDAARPADRLRAP